MRPVVLDELNGQIHVRFAALALGLVEIDGLPVTGGLGDADRTRDRGFVHLGAKVFLHLLHYLHREVVAQGEHREHHALDVQIGVVLFADGLEGADELRQTFQRIILALHRDQHTVAGAQTVQGEQVQAGRAVDEDEVIVLLHPGQRLAQAALAARQVDHFQAGTGQTGVGTDHIGAELGFADGLGGGGPANEHLVGAALHAPLGDAVAGGGVALGVQVHDEHLFAQSRHAGGQVDGGRGLADAAFLVCDCYNFCHAHFFLPGNFGCSTWNIRSCARSFPVARTSQLVV